MKRVPQCIVSDSFRFIYLAIAKNATSTLRKELEKDRYGGFRSGYSSIDPESRESYYHFSIIRNPVSRLLSGYQEISMRQEEKPSEHDSAFFHMPEGPERFLAFLDEIEKRRQDSHILDQTAFLPEDREIFFGCLEYLERDLGYIYQHLGLGDLPELPYLRSRIERKERYHYEKHLMYEDDLEEDLIRRIERIYEEDVLFYRQVMSQNRKNLVNPSSTE